MREYSEEVIRIRPQPGFQTKVALSTADITVIGGAAGCGKSFIMLWLVARYVKDPMLRAVFFRETMAQIRQSGSLWDESTKMYPLLGGDPTESNLKWRFPSGAIVDFEGIQYEKDLLNFQGAAIPFILFDELTQFTKSKFMYMLSRNRGKFLRPGEEGYLQKPQIFASCNPDPDSWVAILIAWYIDQETGYPIKEREGVMRYFAVINDVFCWGNTPREVYESNRHYFEDENFKRSGIHPKNLIKSFTFIGGSIYENKELLDSNPQYLGSLMAQSKALQDSLLKGNWKVRQDDTGVYPQGTIANIFKDVDLGETRTTSTWYRGQESVGIDLDYANNFISCDAAKFGRDLCVILVWKKFVVIHCSIFYHSSPQDIYEEIELLRSEFGVLRLHVVIDQDGVGGDVVKLGRYCGFIANSKVVEDETTREKENYKTFKDQCYFRSGKRCEEGGLKWLVLQSTVKIYDKGARRPRWSFMLDWNREKVDLKVLVEKQLRSIKRGKEDFEGGKLKLCTNTKDEQKEILGHSPDFADCVMMREYFELKGKKRVKSKTY